MFDLRLTCVWFNVCLFFRCGTCDDYRDLITSDKTSSAKKAYYQHLLDGHHIEQGEQRMKYWRACARAHENPWKIMTILFDWMTASRASVPQLMIKRKDADFRRPGCQVK
jgi:hypothetical protein